MTFHILHPYGREAALWQSFVDQLSYEQRDVMLTPAYARVQRAVEDGEPICLVSTLRDSDAELLPSLLQGHELKSFYGGINTWRDMDMAWRRELGLTSEYRQTIGIGSGEKVKDAVIIDIDKSDDKLFASFSRNRQRGIKAAAMEATVEFVDASDNATINRFDALYCTNMERLSAKEYWRYSEGVWQAYASELAPAYMSILAAKIGVSTASMLMVLHGYGKAYAHFIAGQTLHDLLYYEAMRYCRDIGCKTLFLGGGTTTSPDDPLLQYKLGFSKKTVPVYVYKREYVEESGMNKKYVGEKWGDQVYVVTGKKRKKLDPRLDAIQRSPAGFMWGVDQCESEQLAFAILADALDDDNRAKQYYMRFKRRIVLGLARDMGWTLTLDQVLKEVDDIENTEKSFMRERQRIEREPPPAMSDRGTGIVWDNEPTGGRK